jgi:hypothetical protein
MDAAGIRGHIYAILGFPTENREEIATTEEFSISSIGRYRYLTVSPNLFYLMAGSAMEQNSETNGIQLNSKRESTRLVLDFYEPLRDANREFAQEAVREIHKEQFLRHADDPAFAEEFWHFVDQTGIFYVQKVVHADSPYLALANVASSAPGLNHFLERKYDQSRLYVLETPSSQNELILCDWVTNNYARMSIFMRPLIDNFDVNLSLRDNIRRCVPTEMQGDAVDIFHTLVENHFYRARSDSNVPAALV